MRPGVQESEIPWADGLVHPGLCARHHEFILILGGQKAGLSFSADIYCEAIQNLRGGENAAMPADIKYLIRKPPDTHLCHPAIHDGQALEITMPG